MGIWIRKEDGFQVDLTLEVVHESKTMYLSKSWAFKILHQGKKNTQT